MTAEPTAAALSEVRPWYRDSASCLHSSLGVLAGRFGADPLEVCGLAWGFRYRPGDVRGEEFYWPAADSEDPIGSLAPHHPLRSRWRVAGGPRPLEELAAALAVGHLPVAAVDNYHLPFRPAYHDVHAAHVLVVDGLAGDTVHVCDPVPPAYHGPLDSVDFLRSWESVNASDIQDPFFSDAPIERRWLEVTVSGPMPVLNRERCAQALRTNLSGLLTEPVDGDQTGIPGLVAFVDQLALRTGDGAVDAAVEAYVFGWCMQAQAALHGELLRVLGSRWRVPELAEAGRRVEQVAHAWTAVRVSGAHAATHGEPLEPIAGHARRLPRLYEVATETVAEAVAALHLEPEPA